MLRIPSTEGRSVCLCWAKSKPEGPKGRRSPLVASQLTVTLSTPPPGASKKIGLRSPFLQVIWTRPLKKTAIRNCAYWDPTVKLCLGAYKSPTGVRFLMSQVLLSTLHTTCYTVHPAPCILDTAPYTLHTASHAIYSACYTLHTLPYP